MCWSTLKVSNQITENFMGNLNIEGDLEMSTLI